MYCSYCTAGRFFTAKPLGFVSLGLLFLGISYKWDHIICDVCDWLLSLSIMLIKVHTCCSMCCSSTFFLCCYAKSLQSCLTLCDPIDGSPPGSPVPGILQARTLESVAISFSKAWKWKVKVNSLSRVWLRATPWTAAYQAPPSMGFSRQEYWSGVPLPSPVITIYIH